MNVLAFVETPISKTILAKNFKSFYTESCLPKLKNTVAVKEDSQTGELSLHSALFRSAILVHIVRTVEEGDNWFVVGNKIINEMAEKESFPQNGFSDPE